MSDLKEIAAAIRGRFDTLVATPNSIPTAHDNVRFAPPAGRWARLSIQFGLQQAASVGLTRYRTAGVALAQLYCPIEEGDGALLTVAESCQDAFRGVTLSGPPHITFRAPYVSAPPARDEGWWQVVVAIPFVADEFSA